MKASLNKINYLDRYFNVRVLNFNMRVLMEKKPKLRKTNQQYYDGIMHSVKKLSNGDKQSEIEVDYIERVLKEALLLDDVL
jgi:hypothetical protein